MDVYEGFNTAVYRESEIERIGHLAFKLAGKRNKKLCSIDKANVLASSRLWRRVVNETLKNEYPSLKDIILYEKKLNINNNLLLIAFDK